MIDQEQLILDDAIARLRAGETLSGSFMYDHGLASPIVGCSRLRFVEGVFHWTTWTEEPVVDSVPMNQTTRVLDERGVRDLLAADRPMRSALGLK